MAFVPGRGLADVVKHLDAGARALAKAKGAGWELADDALQKLRWLESDGRDFRKVTPTLTKKMSAAFAKKLDDVLTGKAAVDAPTEAAVTVFKNEVAQRLETGGGDVTMTPLKTSTIKQKGHDRVGDDTGQLKRAVKRAKVRTVR